jgi:hypothetical protein
MRGLIKFDGKAQMLPDKPTVEYPSIDSARKPQPPAYVGVMFLTVRILPDPAKAAGPAAALDGVFGQP